MNEIKEGLARRPEGESQMSLIDRLREFLEMEARSGSMDSGCISKQSFFAVLRID